MPSAYLSTVLLLWSVLTVSAQNLSSIDILVTQFPRKINITRLINEVEKNSDTDLEIVRGYYSWILQNVEYDHFSGRKERAYNFDPIKVFQKRKGVCTGYVTLFHHLLNESGIVAEEVSGYSKGSILENFDEDYPDHVWSAILIDGEWNLYDLTWDACLSRDLLGRLANNSFDYFHADPDQFIKDHYPSLPMWQLRDSIFAFNQFKRPDLIAGAIDSIQVQDFEIAIIEFRALSQSDQKIYLDSVNYALFPTSANADQYGHRLLDFAGVLVDSIESSKEMLNSDEIENMMRKIISLCAEADQLVTSFHNWQNEMYSGTMINYIIHQFNNAANKEGWSKEDWQNLMYQTEIVKLILQRADDSFYKDASLSRCEEIISNLEPYLSE